MIAPIVLSLAAVPHHVNTDLTCTHKDWTTLIQRDSGNSRSYHNSKREKISDAQKIKSSDRNKTSLRATWTRYKSPNLNWLIRADTMTCTKREIGYLFLEGIQTRRTHFNLLGGISILPDI